MLVLTFEPGSMEERVMLAIEAQLDKANAPEPPRDKDPRGPGALRDRRAPARLRPVFGQ